MSLLRHPWTSVSDPHVDGRFLVGPDGRHGPSTSRCARRRNGESLLRSGRLWTWKSKVGGLDLLSFRDNNIGDHTPGNTVVGILGLSEEGVSEIVLPGQGLKPCDTGVVQSVNSLRGWGCAVNLV